MNNHTDFIEIMYTEIIKVNHSKLKLILSIQSIYSKDVLTIHKAFFIWQREKSAVFIDQIEKVFDLKLFIGFEYGAKNGKNVTGVCNCNDGNGVVLVNSSSEITSLCEKNLSLWCQFESQKKGVALSLLNLSWVLLNNFIYLCTLEKKIGYKISYPD